VPLVKYSLVGRKEANAGYEVSGRSRLCGAQPKTKCIDIGGRIRTKDVCMVARQLATLLHAGMPLVPALCALAEQLRKVFGEKKRWLSWQENRLAEMMQQVSRSVNGGSTLAEALGRHRHAFSSLFVNMVAAGEASGTLEDALVRLAEMLQKRTNLAGKVKSAVAYPLMMVVVAIGVVWFLMWFVVPSVTEIFIEMNRTLPWPTRLLIWISNFMKSYFWVAALLLLGTAWAIRAWLGTREGKLVADRYKLKLPVFGKLFLELEIARLSRTLAVLFGGGIPVLDALDIGAGVVRNSFIAKALDSVRDRVSRGDNVAEAIRKSGVFPPIVYHIVSTGQVGGSLEDGLTNVADMYEEEVETSTKTLTSLIEPAVLLVMGAAVGFIVLAILLPIFEINRAF